MEKAVIYLILSWKVTTDEVFSDDYYIDVSLSRETAIDIAKNYIAEDEEDGWPTFEDCDVEKNAYAAYSDSKVIFEKSSMDSDGSEVGYYILKKLMIESLPLKEQAENLLEILDRFLLLKGRTERQITITKRTKEIVEAYIGGTPNLAREVRRIINNPPVNWWKYLKEE